MAGFVPGWATRVQSAGLSDRGVKPAGGFMVRSVTMVSAGRGVDGISEVSDTLCVMTDNGTLTARAISLIEEKSLPCPSATYSPKARNCCSGSTSMSQRVKTLPVVRIRDSCATQLDAGIRLYLRQHAR